MKRFLLTTFALSLIAASWTTHAAERPLWELAVGGGVITLPFYRGAKENRTLPIPFIYPVYRGDFLKVDEEGVHGRFLRSDRVVLDFSADGTVPSSGSDVKVREGMPELDATFQLGPSLTIDLWDRGKRSDKRLILTLPLRAVFTVESSPSYIGLASSPKLTYQRDVKLADRYWRLAMTGGVELGSNKLHDYFYTVDPVFQTPDRPAFEAREGYAGTRFTLSAQSRQRKNYLAFFIRYDNVSGATFEDSPLVERTGNITAGVVFAWFVAKSKKTVTVPDKETLKF